MRARNRDGTGSTKVLRARTQDVVYIVQDEQSIIRLGRLDLLTVRISNLDCSFDHNRA